MKLLATVWKSQTLHIFFLPASLSGHLHDACLNKSSKYQAYMYIHTWKCMRIPASPSLFNILINAPALPYPFYTSFCSGLTLPIFDTNGYEHKEIEEGQCVYLLPPTSILLEGCSLDSGWNCLPQTIVP